MSVSEVPTEQVRAYQRTRYIVRANDASFALCIGQQSEEIAELIQKASAVGGAFITAENPYSEALAANENKARQDHLREDLVGLGAVVVDGAGQGDDPSWPAEASYAAIGISREQACELGRKYQ